MGTPDWSGYLASGPWAGSYDGVDFSAIIGVVSNIVVGSNPPYTIQDFFQFYPKWGGTPLSVPGATLVAGNEQITLAAAPPAGLAVGNPVAGPNIPDGTTVTAISGETITLSNAPTEPGTGVTLTAWNAPLIPIVVLQLYIALASASLVQGKWLDTWPFAMALYIAHFATLYARSDGNPNSNVGQAAAQGLAFGIQVATSVGDLSVTYEPVPGLEDWGAWNLTTFGQQLATFAKVIGMGPMMLY
jgi:hypothetical protein